MKSANYAAGHDGWLPSGHWANVHVDAVCELMLAERGADVEDRIRFLGKLSI
jgi:hypothetical protein